jgi:hypothetical protein
MSPWLTAQFSTLSPKDRPMQSDEPDSTIEQKYLFAEQREKIIFDWLRYCCMPDSQYYFSEVFSIYYDTPRLDLYYEKRNSDYIKTKVRLRWYTAWLNGDGDCEVPCYLEVKRKYGIRRSKKRIALTMAKKNLFQAPFSDATIRDLPKRVHELSYDPPGILVPILVVNYRRYRFFDQASGSRIALDTQIQCSNANALFLTGFPPVHLRVGVLEIKGNLNNPLKSLTAVRPYLTKDSFSKYARCCEELMYPLGRRI